VQVGVASAALGWGAAQMLVRLLMQILDPPKHVSVPWPYLALIAPALMAGRSVGSAGSSKEGKREPTDMRRFIETYDGRPFDVIVVGGGISGAAVAYDAASRGLSVALLEKQDFGCATSAATSKLIHEGFRYLANLEFGLVRQKNQRREGKRPNQWAGCEIKDINAFMDGVKSENKDFEERTLDRLGRHYGTECQRVIDMARADKSLAEPLDPDGELAAQVVYAIREEMALTLKDIFLRRTGLGTLGDPGDEVINKVADLAAAELSWDKERKGSEVAQVKQTLQLPA